MSDPQTLVARLREDHPTPYAILKEAANRIEELERLVERYQELVVDEGLE